MYSAIFLLTHGLILFSISRLSTRSQSMLYSKRADLSVGILSIRLLMCFLLSSDEVFPPPDFDEFFWSFPDSFSLFPVFARPEPDIGSGANFFFLPMPRPSSSSWLKTSLTSIFFLARLNLQKGFWC